MVLIGLGVYGKDGYEKLSEHTRAGFMFGIKIFAPVFLIAAFFFMGSPGTAKQIFGEGAKGLLFPARPSPLGGINPLPEQKVAQAPAAPQVAKMPLPSPDGTAPKADAGEASQKFPGKGQARRLGNSGIRQDLD